MQIYKMLEKKITEQGKKYGDEETHKLKPPWRKVNNFSTHWAH